MKAFQPRGLWIALAAISALILISGIYLIYASVGAVPSNPNTPITPDVETIVIEGTYICLPRADNTKEKECTPGIESGVKIYALDLAQVIETGATPKLTNGTKIVVGGTMVPIEMISSDQWKKYTIDGILQVEEIARQ